MSVSQLNDMLPNRRRMDVQDDEFISVSEGRIRIRIGVVIFMSVLILVILRLAEVSLFGDKLGARNLPQAITTTRADIIDRRGEVLATTLQTFSLYAEPRRIWNVEETARQIVSVRSELDYDIIKERLASDRSFVWLERGLTPRARQAVFALGLPGLAFRQEPKRVYPRGSLSSHVLGFTNIDLEGAAGAEGL